MVFLQQDILEHILKYLDDESILNFIKASDRFAQAFAVSPKLLREFVFRVDVKNDKRTSENITIPNIPVKNISIKCNGLAKQSIIVNLLENHKICIENFELIDLNAKDFKAYQTIFSDFFNLKNISLENCKIKSDVHGKLAPIPTLTSIVFNKCDASTLKVFCGQPNLTKITIQNEDWDWNGFSHQDFNEIVKNSPNLTHIVLLGDGTGSYFDSDEFPYKIRKLETTLITFHWYVGIKSARLNFLRPQTGALKELTIHKLPYDFDGGKVLKYIIEEMALDKFYYGNIPLIQNGKKQEVKRFSANEIQIQSVFEMFRQYPTVEVFELVLSPTDIASDEIESIIDERTNLFNNLIEFILVDNSGYRGIFGVFLSFYKNLRNIRKLTFRTLDRNINVILEECLSEMRNLEEICLTSTAPRAEERFQIIKRFVPKLKKITLDAKFVDEAKRFFSSGVEISTI